ncbi:MAG: HAD family hydrolase [Clostridia bacterium]|nr:HAD family hydrolase [Loktanella sp.]MBQ1951095.1 HAD family hydrolase [Clostridia bacterium]
MDNKIVVFDLDDTLVDSHRRFEDAILTLLDAHGIAYDARQVIANTNPLGASGTAVYFSALGVPGTIEEIYEQLMRAQEEFYASRVSLLPGALDYLHRLSAQGARLFVLTASPHRLSDGCLRSNAVYTLFEQVWCTEDFGHNKGEEALFHKVTAAIGCAPEQVLYYDDGVTAIRTARAAGWQTCGVLSAYAAESDRMEQAAHSCIHSFEEILSAQPR